MVGSVYICLPGFFMHKSSHSFFIPFHCYLPVSPFLPCIFFHFSDRSSSTSALGSIVWNCNFPKPHHPLGTYAGVLILIPDFSGSFLQTADYEPQLPENSLLRIFRLSRGMCDICCPLLNSVPLTGHSHSLLRPHWLCVSAMTLYGAAIP